MPDKRLNVIAAVAVVALLFLIYLVVSYDGGAPEVAEQEAPPRVAEPAPPPEPEPVVAPPEPEPVPIVEPEEPAIAEVEEPPAPEPVAEPESEPEPEPEPALPDLNASDDFVLAQLRELESGARLTQLVTNNEVIRKFVIFTDNVSRGIVPERETPVQRPREPIEVRQLDENVYVMDPATHARFDAMIDTFLAVDTEQAMMLYQSLAPLFQEAYAELGYPGRDFEDTLVQAIDRVLEAPAPQGTLRLVRPSVNYDYADPELENRSAVAKLLLRLGPGNTEKLKGKLREFRERLAAME